MSKGRLRITDFPGFSIENHTNGLDGFNPFADEKESVASKKVVPKPNAPIVIEFASSSNKKNQDTPITANLNEQIQDPPALCLFPQAPPIIQPVPESESEIPMIQPRNKEGQRLLYKVPNCPKVGPRGAYWLLVGQSDKSATAHLLQFDGGANPNPGPASAGAVLWSPIGIDGKRSVLFESGKFLGRATNNIAESQGLYLGLQIAANRGARELLIEGDSELIVFQQIGKYQVKDKNLKGWWSQIQAAMMDETSFDWIAIRQLPRELNERADSITKEVLQTRSHMQRA